MHRASLTNRMHINSFSLRKRKSTNVTKSHTENKNSKKNKKKRHKTKLI